MVLPHRRFHLPCFISVSEECHLPDEWQRSRLMNAVHIAVRCGPIKPDSVSSYTVFVLAVGYSLLQLPKTARALHRDSGWVNGGGCTSQRIFCPGNVLALSISVGSIQISGHDRPDQIHPIISSGAAFSTRVSPLTAADWSSVVQKDIAIGLICGDVVSSEKVRLRVDR